MANVGDNRKVKTAVVGCGAISDIYITNMINKYTTLEVVCCCANHLESAKKKAEKYGIEATTYEEILKDKSIEMVVILTPAPTHFELIQQALLAGKHVYTEKPLTVELKDGEKLLQMADEKKLYLGAAPETFLGSRFQTARKAIEDGMIGEVTSFQISGNRDYDFFASVYPFLRGQGGGICYDYGVYYLTALISLLGPVDKTFAIVKNRNKERINIFPESLDYGKTFIFDNESQVTSVIQLESGITGNFALNGDTNVKDLGEFIIYGTKGVLKLGNPNLFGEDVIFIPNDHSIENWMTDQSKVIEPVSALTDNCRGIGPAEMAYSIMNSEKSRVSKELPYHVLDTISQIMKSGETGKIETVESTCSIPKQFDEWRSI